MQQTDRAASWWCAWRPAYWLDRSRRLARPEVELVLEANRVLAEEELVGADVIREPLQLSA